MEKLEMSRIVLTKKEITAIRKSVEHWDKDIIRHFRDGDTIEDHKYSPRWKNSNKLVMMFSKDCPLCRMVRARANSSYKCENCPYTRAYHRDCDMRGHWSNFYNNQNLAAAKLMRNALAKIIGMKCI